MSRVLLVGKGAPERGGIPTFLEDLRSGQLARRHEIDFLNLTHDGTPEGGAITWGNVRRTLTDAWSVWSRGRGHDVVHINSALAPSVTVLRAGLLALAGRLAGCAVVMHAHGGNIETYMTSTRTRLVMRLAMMPASVVVACWTAGHDALASALGRRRVTLVLNGVDVERFEVPTERPHHPPRILYVGLLTPRKGVLDLIHASNELRDEGIEHELRLLGGTPDEGPAAAEPVLEAAHASANLLGTRTPDEMPQEYASADVFCLPSWWEAMPLSVLEAMAAGMPVVATDVGEVGKIVLDGATGLVVPPECPERLADALRTVLVDRLGAQEMGQEGRRRAQAHFSSRSTSDQIDAVYASVQRAGRR
jgi:glycosyltransferase involved in cell wall biosynthesis